MKRWFCCILVAALLVFGLVACSYESEDSPVDDSPMFISIAYEGSYEVVYHRDSKVMYVVSNGSYNRGTFTLLVNPDGSPMLYEGGN